MGCGVCIDEKGLLPVIAHRSARELSNLLSLGPRRSPSVREVSVRRRGGFTIVEMLVAVALTLLLMTMVVSVMSQVMDSISTSRASIEMNDRLRFVRERIQNDLGGITLFPNPPHRPEAGEGYFEYIEGPMGATAPRAGALANGLYALDTDEVAAVMQPPDVAPGVDFTGWTNAGGYAPDRTVGDLDDIIMFTAHAQGEPFVGRAGFDGLGNPLMVQSQVAEIAYFVRGTTLYRRVLLVRPDIDLTGVTTNYYARYDISARQEGGPAPQNLTANTAAAYLVANSLGDLTKRENRFGHQPYHWPHDARFWGALGLPTLFECSDPTWPFPYNNGPGGPPSGSLFGGADLAGREYVVPDGVSNPTTGRLLLSMGSLPFDAWRNPHPYTEVDRLTGMLSDYQNGTRIGEDVLLTDVLSFDVKVWDPGAPIVQDAAGAVHQPGDPGYSSLFPATTIVGHGAFVDLNYLRERDTSGGIVAGTPNGFVERAEWTSTAAVGEPPLIQFGSYGDERSQVAGAGATATAPFWPAVYDTWSTHYEHDGINQGDYMRDGTGTLLGQTLADEGTDGIDNDGQNGVDDPGEMEAPPPYPNPLRAMQVKIRVFEPDSRQIREVTIVHEFLPK